MKARVADRRPFVPRMKLTDHDAVTFICMPLELLDPGVAEVVCRAIGRQIAEGDDDCFVAGVIALSRLCAQEQSLVAVNELDQICRAVLSDRLSSEPERPAFQGPRHEWTYGSRAAEILVRPRNEIRDPVCDCAQCMQIAVRELPRVAGVLKILKHEDIAELGVHGVLPCNDWNAARSSEAKSSGCSHAAK